MDELDSHGARTLAEQISTGRMSVTSAADCSDAFIKDGASKAATHVPSYMIFFRVIDLFSMCNHEAPALMNFHVRAHDMYMHDHEQ